MSQVQSLSTVPSPFQFQDKPIRAQLQGDTLWFVARDVCDALNISWSGQTLSSLPQGWKGMISYINPQGNQRLRAITEPGVYKLAFRSNKPEADVFTNWIASEVIPSIRKTGKYEMPKPSTPADSHTLSTAESRKPLRALVYAWSQVSGQHISTLWPQVKAHFQLARIDDLPEAWLPDALAFVQGKIDSRAQQPQMTAQQPQMALPANEGPAGLAALLQLGYMPFDPSPISHVCPEDRELDSIFRTIRGCEGQFECMEKENKLPPIPKGQEANVKRLRETFFASCYVARRALGAIYEMGRDARIASKQRVLAQA